MERTPHSLHIVHWCSWNVIGIVRMACRVPDTTYCGIICDAWDNSFWVGVCTKHMYIVHTTKIVRTLYRLYIIN